MPAALHCRDLAEWNRLAAGAFGDIGVDAGADRFEAAMTVRDWQGLRLVEARSSPARVRGGTARPSADWYIVLGVQGRATVCQGAGRVTLGAGEASVLRAADPWEIRFDRPHHALVAALPPPEDAATRRELDSRRACRHASDEAQELARLMLRCCRMEPAAAARLDAPRLARLLIDLLLLAPPAADVASRETASSHGWSRIADCVQRRLVEPELAAASIAAELGLSVRTVQYAFSRQGTTLGAYLLGQRLQAVATRLREEPGTGVARIAFEAGFADLSHFCRSFKRQYGCSASGWRRDAA